MRYIGAIDMLINEELVHSVEKTQRKSKDAMSYYVTVNIDREVKSIKCDSVEHQQHVFDSMRVELCRK